MLKGAIFIHLQRCIRVLINVLLELECFIGKLESEGQFEFKNFCRNLKKRKKTIDTKII
jgi:hypothetical protein